MLYDNKTGILLDAPLIFSICSLLKPVVPMTIGSLLCSHCERISIVDSGLEKSITTSESTKLETMLMPLVFEITCLREDPSFQRDH